MTVRFASRIVGAHRRFPRKRRAHGQGEERHPPVDKQWARADTGIGQALAVTYADSGGVTHGFLRSASGVFTNPIDPPGSTFTQAEGINDFGTIVGFYDDASGDEHGFSLRGGVYTTWDVPGATLTDIFSINNSNQVVGEYIDTAGVTHGFLSTIPAPPSLLLLGTGVLGLLGYGLRRRFC